MYLKVTYFLIGIVLCFFKESKAQNSDTLLWEFSVHRDSISSETYQQTLQDQLSRVWRMSLKNRPNCIIGIRLKGELPTEPTLFDFEHLFSDIEKINLTAQECGIPKEQIFQTIRNTTNPLGPSAYVVVRVNLIHKYLQSD